MILTIILIKEIITYFSFYILSYILQWFLTNVMQETYMSIIYI